MKILNRFDWWDQVRGAAIIAENVEGKWCFFEKEREEVRWFEIDETPDLMKTLARKMRRRSGQRAHILSRMPIGA